MRKIFILFLIFSFLLMGMGCAEWSRMQKGAAIGAGAGGALGALIGHKAGSTAVGVLLGAAIGGAAGAYIGNYMDKQAAEIERDIAGARVERVGEGIKITFSSGIMFDVDKAVLKEQYKGELRELSTILNKYEDTNILLEGHTDSTGSEEYNLDLSKKRAQSVANYLATQNVNPARFTIMGYGESQPIASNETAEGRAQNRRVEVAIYANEKLKKVAMEKTR
ncbi:MAG: OmpA family protein [Deltaproteobacteria bacterium]|nr:OmpA family protein [Deltaproteobacteria bacterium]